MHPRKRRPRNKKIEFGKSIINHRSWHHAAVVDTHTRSCVDNTHVLMTKEQLISFPARFYIESAAANGGSALAVHVFAATGSGDMGGRGLQSLTFTYSTEMVRVYIPVAWPSKERRKKAQLGSARASRFVRCGILLLVVEGPLFPLPAICRLCMLRRIRPNLINPHLSKAQTSCSTSL